MGFYGVKETWKVVYSPKIYNGGTKGVALVEAADKHDALYTFGQQYAGQYTAIESCEKLFK